MLLYTDVAFEGEGSHIPPQAALLALSTVAFDVCVCVFSPMAGGGLRNSVCFSPPKFTQLLPISHIPPLQKISSKFVYDFLSYPANRQSDK